jgi:hypothetical protein
VFIPTYFADAIVTHPLLNSRFDDTDWTSRYWEKRITLEDHNDVIAISLPTRNKKKARKSIKLSNDYVEQHVDLSDDSLPDHPIMWITIDPQMEW